MSNEDIPGSNSETTECEIPAKKNGMTNKEIRKNSLHSDAGCKLKQIEPLEKMDGKLHPKCDKSKSEMSSVIDSLQNISINGNEASEHNDSNDTNTTHDVDKLTDTLNNLGLGKDSGITEHKKATEGLVCRGPAGGTATSHRPYEYYQAHTVPHYRYVDGRTKRGRDNEGDPDYKFTKPEQNRLFDPNSAAYLSETFISPPQHPNIYHDKTLPAYQDVAPYEVRWQNNAVSEVSKLDKIANVQLATEIAGTVPDIATLDDLLDMLPDSPAEVIDNQDKIHKRNSSGDEGIDVSEVLSPINSEVFSPDSGVGSPGSDDNVLSPSSGEHNYRDVQVRDPAEYMHGSPYNLIGSPQSAKSPYQVITAASPAHMMSSPQHYTNFQQMSEYPQDIVNAHGQILGSPQQILSGVPQQVIHSPQMTGSPNQFYGSPRMMSPEYMMESPQQIVGNQRVMRNPQHMMNSPQSMVGSPVHMAQLSQMHSPQQVTQSPNHYIDSTTYHMEYPNNMIANQNQMVTANNQMYAHNEPIQQQQNTAISKPQEKKPAPKGAKNSKQTKKSTTTTKKEATVKQPLPSKVIEIQDDVLPPPTIPVNGVPAPVIDAELDVFFNVHKDYLNDVNNTLVNDLIEAELNDTASIKKLLDEQDVENIQTSAIENNIPSTEIENIVQKSKNQSKFDGYLCEDFSDGTHDSGELIDALFRPSYDTSAMCNSANLPQSTYPIPNIGNCYQHVDVVPGNTPIAVQQQLQQPAQPVPNQIQQPIQQCQQQPNLSNLVQQFNTQMPGIHAQGPSTLSTPQMTTTPTTTMSPVVIQGQQRFVVAQNITTQPNQPIILRSPTSPIVPQNNIQPYITQLPQNQQPVNTITQQPAQLIHSPLGTSTTGNQFIFLPVQVIPTTNQATINQQVTNQPTKTRKPSAKTPRKILPKSPPILPPTTVAPITSSAPRSLRPTPALAPVQTSVAPAMNGCLNVSSTNKLNIARRCVANMTREDLQFKDGDGDTYLHVAVCRTDPHLVQAMLERIQREGLLELIDAQNSKRQTPLYLAVAANQPVMVRLFVKCGADVNSMTQAILPNGKVEVKAAIHCAAGGCDAYVNTMRELIQSKDINLNMANSEGLSALHCAILEHGRPKGDNSYNNSTEITQLLIRAGADPNVQDKSTGKTPLMYAIQTLHYPLVESLVSTVSRINRPLLHKMIKTQTFDGSTCIRVASSLQINNQKDLENFKNIKHLLLSTAQNLTLAHPKIY